MRRSLYPPVDTEGLPMRVVVHSAPIQDRDGPGWSLTNTPAHPVAQIDLGRWLYNAWQVEAAVAKIPVLRVVVVKRSDDMRVSSSCPGDG